MPKPLKHDIITKTGGFMNEFKFCPNCGSQKIKTIEGIKWQCDECGYKLYHNTAAAVALFLHCQGKLLTFTRTKEPGKGKYGIPGGFVNPAENLEEACKRECFEEVGIEPENFQYLASFPNVYPYKGIIYNTCDAFYAASFAGTAEELLTKTKTIDGEAENCRLIEIENVDIENFAFESHKKAFALFKASLKK